MTSFNRYYTYTKLSVLGKWNFQFCRIKKQNFSTLTFIIQERESWIISDLNSGIHKHKTLTFNSLFFPFEIGHQNGQPNWGFVIRMQHLWLCIWEGRQFEESYEISFWGKIVQMHPMWLCIRSTKQFKETFENSLWGKILQMQPVQLCLCWCSRFEGTFKNSLWRKTI